VISTRQAWVWARRGGQMQDTVGVAGGEVGAAMDNSRSKKGPGRDRT
jgi:hypothetical protein